MAAADARGGGGGGSEGPRSSGPGGRLQRAVGCSGKPFSFLVHFGALTHHTLTHPSHALRLTFRSDVIPLLTLPTLGANPILDAGSFFR